MKHELKIEFKETQILKSLLEETYKDGYLFNRDTKIVIEETSPIYILCKGLNNLTVRIWNEEIIDGPWRFIIQENVDIISLHPCSIKYEIDNDKYSFLN